MMTNMPLWRLRDAHGVPAHCYVKRVGPAWLLIVCRGADEFVTEHHRVHSRVLARATEIHGVFTELGYTEPVH